MDKRVSLDIINGLGQTVEQLISDQYIRGKATVRWCAGQLAVKSYFGRLIASSGIQMKKIFF